jgi:hypothetical protein
MMYSLLRTLDPLSAWAKRHFFKSPSAKLFELTPLEALQIDPIPGGSEARLQRLIADYKQQGELNNLIEESAVDYVHGYE